MCHMSLYKKNPLFFTGEKVGSIRRYETAFLLPVCLAKPFQILFHCLGIEIARMVKSINLPGFHRLIKQDRLLQSVGDCGALWLVKASRSLGKTQPELTAHHHYLLITIPLFGSDGAISEPHWGRIIVPERQSLSKLAVSGSLSWVFMTARGMLACLFWPVLLANKKW